MNVRGPPSFRSVAQSFFLEVVAGDGDPSPLVEAADADTNKAELVVGLETMTLLEEVVVNPAAFSSRAH